MSTTFKLSFELTEWADDENIRLRWLQFDNWQDFTKILTEGHALKPEELPPIMKILEGLNEMLAVQKPAVPTKAADPNYQPGGMWSGGPGMPYGT